MGTVRSELLEIKIPLNSLNNLCHPVSSRDHFPCQGNLSQVESTMNLGGSGEEPHCRGAEEGGTHQ